MPVGGEGGCASREGLAYSLVALSGPASWSSTKACLARLQPPSVPSPSH